MQFSGLYNDHRRFGTVILCSVVLFGILSSVSYGVTTFDTDIGAKERPAPFDSDDMWFYDQNMARVIPDMDFDWLSVVFRGGLVTPEKSDAATEGEALFLQRAKQIVEAYTEIVDYFYDRNLAMDACFFRLREGLKGKLVGDLIAALNRQSYVAYAHPAIRVGDKTYAFFNAFEMEWKTGVEQEAKDRIMSDAHIAWDKSEYVYRANLSRIPFFKAINLLAEDIHVLKVTPYLVELKPSIRAELAIPISGSDLGDEIPFSLNVVFSELVTIDPSSIANIDLRPAEIQKELFDLKFDPYDYVEASSKSPIKITGWMKFYTPGEFVIPSVKIHYSCSTYSDNRVKSVETDPLPFKVSSIVPPKLAEKNLIVPTDHIDPDYKTEYYQEKARTSLLWSLSFFFIALLCAGWLALRIYQEKREREKLLAAKREDVLAEKLKVFLKEATSGPPAMYMAEVSKLLRAYLVAKYGISPYPSGGSGEVFFQSVKDKLPPSLVPKVSTLFKRIDEVVALDLDTLPGIESLRSEALEIIEAAGP